MKGVLLSQRFFANNIKRYFHYHDSSFSSVDQLFCITLEETSSSASVKRWFSDSRKASKSYDNHVKDILLGIQNGTIDDIDHAKEQILQWQKRNQPLVDSDSSSASSSSSFANLDYNRTARTGFPEVVFGTNKTPKQIAIILNNMAESVNKRLSTFIDRDDGKKTNDLVTKTDVGTTAVFATRYGAVQCFCVTTSSREEGNIKNINFG